MALGGMTQDFLLCSKKRKDEGRGHKIVQNYMTSTPGRPKLGLSEKSDLILNSLLLIQGLVIGHSVSCSHSSSTFLPFTDVKTFCAKYVRSILSIRTFYFFCKL